MADAPAFLDKDRFFALPRDRRLRDFGTYWLGLRGTRRMPRRSDLDPVEFADLLPVVLLSRLVDGLPVYELAGEDVNAFYGRPSIVGLTPSDLVSETTVREIRESLTIVQQHGAARHSRTFYLRDDGAAIWAERLLFPLSEDGKAVDHTITLVVSEVVRAEREGRPGRDGSGTTHYWIAEEPGE